MSQFFQIHTETPQHRLIKQAAEIVRKGGVVVYPTDSAYAIGCHLEDKKAVDKIKRIRRLDDKHHFTLVCRDLGELSNYARVDNVAYRYLKAHTPGAFTFLLDATKEVPKRLMHPKRRTIGIRVPDNAICQALLEELGEPMMSVTLQMPGDEYPMTDPYEIRQTLEHELDLIIDGGHCGLEPSTIIDMTGEEPAVLRQGKGEVEPA